MKSKILSLFGASILSLVTMVLADAGDEAYAGCWGGGMMAGSFGYGGMIFGWLFSILVLVALVLLIIWLIKQIQNPSRKRRK